MVRSFEDSRRWMQDGLKLIADAASGLDEAACSAPTQLPGWTRKHVIAHVAANAEALGNLVHWAATGEPTPMYSSPEARAAGIQDGVRRRVDDLDSWLRTSGADLEVAMSKLTDQHWQTPVVTAQGRTVPAIELPWMRSREVCVHAVDLDRGVAFAHLPADFLTALCDDVVAKRSSSPGISVALIATDADSSWQLPGPNAVATIRGPLADITAYLTGRPHHLAAPSLPAWL